jgi:hypothetical protein
MNTLPVMRRHPRSLLGWLSALLLLIALAAQPTAAEPTFLRLPVGRAVVSLRADAAPLPSSTPLWLHLHGAAATVEAGFARIETPGVLVTLTLPGLSKVYADHFADPATFEALLRDVTAAVRRAQPGSAWTAGELTVSSFSAGFGGVRQLLRQPAAFDRIATIVMADSIYCGYIGPVAEHRVDPALMEGFLRFAHLAAEGRRRMLITHTQQVPDGYASTTETADYLIAAFDGRREPVELAWGPELVPTGRFARQGFEVIGFTGADAKDHLQHLRSLGHFLARARPTPAMSPATTTAVGPQ